MQLYCRLCTASDREACLPCCVSSHGTGHREALTEHSNQTHKWIRGIKGFWIIAWSGNTWVANSRVAKKFELHESGIQCGQITWNKCVRRISSTRPNKWQVNMWLNPVYNHGLPARMIFGFPGDRPMTLGESEVEARESDNWNNGRLHNDWSTF